MKFDFVVSRRMRALTAVLTLASAPFAMGIRAANAVEPHLEKAIEGGKALFFKETFGGNGQTCLSCHDAGGVGAGKMPNGNALPSLANAATIFPRFNPRANKVVTLEDQVRTCVAGALQGKPPAYGSEQMTQLVTYLTSLAQGKPVDMGGKPQ